MPILTARQLKKYYQQGNNTVKALDGVDLRWRKENLWPL